MEQIEYNSYVYIHIKENGEVFYIGLGSDKKYYRAHSKSGRNYFWNKIVKEFPNYKVYIFRDSLCWNDAAILEIKLIKFYGRKDNKEGNLVNLTDGGEGSPGCIISEKARINRGNANRGKVWSKETRERHSKIKKGIPNLKLRGHLTSEETRKKIGLAHKGKIVSQEVRDKISLKLKGHKPSKKNIEILESIRKTIILQYDLQGNFIKEWSSIKEAAEFYNVAYPSISNVCRGITKTSRGFIWKYKIIPTNLFKAV